MKVLYRLFTLILFVTIFSSCDAFLEQEAPSEITSSEFWSSPTEAEQGVAAIYDEAQSTFQNGFLDYGEFRADNFDLTDRPSTTDIQIRNNELDANTGGTNWGSFYTAIATANMAIQEIPNVDEFDGKDDLLAQSHALRAMFYFWAVRVWGDIPKLTEPVLEFDQDLMLERSPSEEIFSEIIIPDLDRAEQLITIQRDRHIMSLGPILALKAHVYMWPGDHQDYTVARDAISQLEELGYSLETTQEGWADIFRGEPQDSDEIVFALAWDFEEDGTNGVVHTFTSLAPIWLISDNLHESWDPDTNDFRRDLSFASLEDLPPAYLDWNVLKKYSGDFEDVISRGNWSNSNDRDLIFYRLSGLLLLKAEAENYLNNPSNALSTLNRVRDARGLDTVDESITDQSTIRDMILEERRFELLGEGHRFWDLVRNGVVMDVMDPIVGWEDERKIFWPVSQDVMDRNPEITQTEGYN